MLLLLLEISKITEKENYLNGAIYMHDFSALLFQLDAISSDLGRTLKRTLIMFV